MSMRFIRAGLISGLFAFAPSLFAQATGTIHGTITDSSGAVVPAVSITITNMGTNLSRSMVADDLGQYVAPLLPAGTYSVTVARAGFAIFEQTGITLQVNTNVQVNATLEPATATQRVTVSGDAALVQTTATNLVQVVDEKRVVDLPLNGRNVVTLMALDAGISNAGATGGTQQINTIGSGGSYSFPVSINGSRGNATNFLLDNADNNDGYTNINEPYGNPDAVKEFSIQTSTFDAQYGRGIGGVVNVVTRSGTNQVHGTVFEFLRNYDMNSANFFSGRDTLKRNQFGFTLGGPVVIPKVYNGKDKTFIFGSYQGTRQASATPASLVLAPSDAMKRGDFSSFLTGGKGAIHDPLSNGGYFPNNQISVTRFDPVSANLLTYFPSSFSSTYQLRFGTPSVYTNDDQFILRADHMISSKQRLSARYFFLHYDRPWAYLPNNLYFVSAGQFGNAQSLTVDHTYSISPRLLNEFTATFHRSTPKSAPPAGLNISFEKLGARVNTVPGFPTMDLSITGWNGTSLGLGYYGPQTTYQLSDGVNYATGKHNIRFGGEVKKYRLDIASYWMSGGTASFTGLLLSDPGQANIGNAFAEFVLGDLASWRQQSFWSERLYNWFTAFYFQDDVRLTQKLTLNIGMRWDPKFDINEIHKKRMTFVPGQQSTVYPNAPLGIIFQGDKGVENGIIPADLNNFAPRFGLAYQLLPKTVIRSAYGIFYDQYMSIFNNRTAGGEPFVRSAFYTGPLSLSNPFGSAEPLNPAPIIPGPNFQFTPYDTWAIPGKNMVAGYMQNWNFVIEQQVRNDLLLRASYVGSKGTHLLNAVEINVPQYIPGQSTAANYNQRRPYQPIAGLQLGKSDMSSHYESAQFTVQKRYSHGISILANYTISKSIDFSSYGSVEGNQINTPQNYRDSRGPSDFDMPQRLVVSGIVEHPQLKGWNALARGVLGGWQSNFIFSTQSGTPITITSGIDNGLMNVVDYADLTGVPWQLPGGRAKQDQILQNFNTAAFRQNAIGTIGTGRRGQLRAPGLWNID